MGQHRKIVPLVIVNFSLHPNPNTKNLCNHKHFLMIKNIISLAFLFFLTLSYGQQAIGPSDNLFDSALIKDENYTMKWLVLQDTISHELGEVTTSIQHNGEKLTLITHVAMPQLTEPWVDSTIVKLKDLAPLYHSSYNQNRDMVIHFEDRVIGYYHDKKTGKKTELDQEQEASFFDSNSYSHLIRWLPLEEGYEQVISIFDFNPNAQTGVITATIKAVDSEVIEIDGQSKEVWKVLVTDDISNNQMPSYYYIDKKSRTLLKQEIEMPGRKMVMERVDFK